MITGELYQRWQRLAGRQAEQEWSTREDLYGLFQAFRPSGAGVEDVINGLPGSEVVLPRLLELYRLTALGNDSAEYVKVAIPTPLTADAAMSLLKAHLNRVQDLAEFQNDREWADDVARMECSVSHHTASDERSVPDDFYAYLCDALKELDEVDSPIADLDGAITALTNDYMVTFYILWPLKRASDTIADPFGPWFRLWTHGATVIYDDFKSATVYLSRS